MQAHLWTYQPRAICTTCRLWLHDTTAQVAWRGKEKGDDAFDNLKRRVHLVQLFDQAFTADARGCPISSMSSYQGPGLLERKRREDGRAEPVASFDY